MKRPRKERDRYTTNIKGSSLASRPGQLGNLHPSGWGHVPQALLRHNEFHPDVTYERAVPFKKGQHNQHYETLPLEITARDIAVYAVISQHGKFEADGRFVARGLRVRRIAERAGIRERQVCRSRERLEAANFLKATRGTGPWVYELLQTAVIPKKAETATAARKGVSKTAAGGVENDSRGVSKTAPLLKTSYTDLSTQTGEVVEENPEPQPFGAEELEARWRDETLNEEAQTRYDRFIEEGGVITTTPQAYINGIRSKLIEEDWFTEKHLPAYRKQQALTQLEECPDCNDAGFILDEYDEPALFDWLGGTGARPMKCQHAGPEANAAYVGNERAKAAAEKTESANAVPFSMSTYLDDINAAAHAKEGDG